MAVGYNKYYQTENLFGEPYPELISFLADFPAKGKLLDLGCGQGRDAIPLARFGYEVIGIDNSKVGINQMNEIAQNEDINLIGIVSDIYSYEDFRKFDFILLDSMFHFSKKDKKKEINLIENIIKAAKKGAIIIYCIQPTGNKVSILNKAINAHCNSERVFETDLQYEYVDSQTGHTSKTDYRIIAIKK